MKESPQNSSDRAGCARSERFEPLQLFDPFKQNRILERGIRAQQSKRFFSTVCYRL